jgi:hypothetical protein
VEATGRFGEQYAIKAFSNCQQRKNYFSVDTVVNRDFDAYAVHNLDRICRFIGRHREVKFVVYFPPYSFLRWIFHKQLDSQFVEDVIGYYFDLWNRLLGLENVEVHNFIDEKEIVFDLRSYSDMMHYNSTVDEKVVDSVLEGKNVITKKNLRPKYASLRYFVANLEMEDPCRKAVPPTRLK